MGMLANEDASFSCCVNDALFFTIVVTMPTLPFVVFPYMLFILGPSLSNVWEPSVVFMSLYSNKTENDPLFDKRNRRQNYPQCKTNQKEGKKKRREKSHNKEGLSFVGPSQRRKQKTKLNVDWSSGDSQTRENQLLN